MFGHQAERLFLWLWRPVLKLISVFSLFLLPVWGYRGDPSVYWMHVIELESFNSPCDVWTYLFALRTGIPPLLSSLELLWWVEFQDLTFFSNIIYPVTIALGFTLAVMIQPARPLPVLIVFFVGLLLAFQGVKVHTRNPAIYDPLFGALLLIYFALINARSHLYCISLNFLSGLVLTMLELTRPFMVFLLPIFVLVEFHRISCKVQHPFRAIIAFSLPLILISGAWHLHLHIAHDGQIAWTNISGYNLKRAWNDFHPEIRKEPNVDELPHRANGMWADLNRKEVYHSSQAVKKIIITKISAEPTRAAAYAYQRVADFINNPTRINEFNPKNFKFNIYRILIISLEYMVIINVFIGAVLLFCQKRWPWSEDNWWFGACIFLVILLVAIGEKGEEGRFLFSVAPAMLAVVGLKLDKGVRFYRHWSEDVEMKTR